MDQNERPADGLTLTRAAGPGPRATTFDLGGELDLASVDRLVEAVGSLASGGLDTVVLDDSALQFADCAGMSAVLLARSLAAARHVELRVDGNGPLCRLIQFFDVHSAGGSALDRPSLILPRQREGLS